MRRYITTVSSAAVAAVLLAASPVLAADLDVVEVRIHATHLPTDTELGWLNPGDTLVLPPNTEVKLWVEAVVAHRGPRYPGARYDVTGGTVVVGDRDRVVVRTNGDHRRVAGIKNAKPEQGAVVIETFGREGDSVIRYTLLDTIEGLSVPKELRTSAFTVSVRDDARIVTGGGELPVTVDDGTVEGLVAELYRGILLRDPDPEGLADYSRRIAERGYQGAIETAVEIARSEESRVDVWRRSGIGVEERLEALYRHLLGVEPSRIDDDQWRADLETLRAGDVARVVDEIVRSEAFRERFGYEPTTRRYVLPRR